MTRRRTAFAGLIGAVLLTAGVVAGLGLAPGQIRPASAQRLSQSVATVVPTVVPTATNGIDVQFTFKAIQQGRAGLIVVNSSNLAASSVTAFGRVYPCFPTHTGFGCLLAVPMDQAVKTGYPVTVNITTKDGVILPAANTFAVSPGGFLSEPITLPGSLLYMIKPDVQANEDARLLGAYSLITPQRYWEGAFSKPVNSIPTSAFGGIRNYNGIATLRHTGQDLQAVVGTPVLASASGRVVLSRLMDIHGNNIVIDHGWGIYSEYAHLSERYVVPGQFVLQGQIIGLSGNTGRSTGPHLHWEIAINGIWVNPLDFMQMTLPPP